MHVKAYQDYQAPHKKKYTRANQAPFLTKEINKEIMTRSRLRNKFLRCRSDENKKAYNEQRNRCVKLVRSAKKAHYSNLSIKDVHDNKNVWKIVKPFFSEKMNTNENITLVDNNNIISSEIGIAEKLNAFFSNIVKELNIKVKENLICDISDINDPVKRAIQKYKLFHLTPFLRIYYLLILKKLRTVMMYQPRLLKQMLICFQFLCPMLLMNLSFLSVLKLADVKPVHKKKSRLEKTNYRPVSLLPNISKVFERCMHRQISEYFETVLSKFQCGFRKGYSTQDCLLAMLENWKKNIRSGERT